MKKIDLIIDALSVAQNSVWSALNEDALSFARELKNELAEPRIPAKIIGPNLEAILNAAGFYRRDAVCCGDYEKCMKPCTPKGRWLANQQMTRLKQEKGQFVGGIPEVSQQREWVGLTGREIELVLINSGYTAENFARAIEANLKEKNT